MRWSVVDFPPPDGPSSTTNSPSSTVNDRWSSTTPRPPGYDFTTSSTSIALRMPLLMLQGHQWRESRRLHRGIQRAEHRHRERERERADEDPRVVRGLEHAEQVAGRG